VFLISQDLSNKLVSCFSLSQLQQNNLLSARPNLTDKVNAKEM